VWCRTEREKRTVDFVKVTKVPNISTPTHLVKRKSGKKEKERKGKKKVCFTPTHTEAL
jgi:hypothetical protein